MKKVLCSSILLMYIFSCGAQEKVGLNPFIKQDSALVSAQKLWFNVHFGIINLTTNPKGVDLLFWNPSLDAVYITKNYRLIKIATSFSRGTSFLITIKYPQYTCQLALMTGKIYRLDTRIYFHYYLGVALIAGRKQESLQYSYEGDGEGNGNFGISPIFPSTIFNMKQFFTIGIPFEIMFRTNRLGYGLYGCLNVELPNVGIRWNMQIGNRKR